MKLYSLKLKNFKGIKDFELTLDGHSAAIYGTNATGKTTLYDAFCWLLFDKDSQDKKDFAIKTLSPDGQPLHGLEHEVEAVLVLAGGKQLTLRKVYYESWTKQRGAAEKTFTGHTTDYFVDGVPVKKAEYQTVITGIADEGAFKLLTNPRHFNETLHWQERRRILLDVCGDIADSEVVAASAALAKLPAILGRRSIDEHRKVIAARRAAINKEIDNIPVRISEVQRGLVDFNSEHEAILASDIQILRHTRQGLQAKLARIEAGGEVAQKTKQLHEVEGAIILKMTAHRVAVADAASQHQAALHGLRDDVDAQRRAVQRMIERIKLCEEERAAHLVQMDVLRRDWHNVNDRGYVGGAVCPACGQDLPDEQIDEALREFNATKAEKLEAIAVLGRKRKGAVAALDEMSSVAQAELTEAQAKLAEVEDALTREQGAYQLKGQRLAPAFETTPEYVALDAKRQALQGEIALLRSNSQAARQEVLEEIAVVEDTIADKEQELAKVEDSKRGLARIEDLKAQEKNLASEFEMLMQQLYLTEEFVKTKVRLLEGKINSRFELAKFKLFDVQVNGGVVECCETTLGGVPYSTGLNRGHQALVGLDIISTLAAHYNFAPPIFYDNAEGIAILPEMQQQVIALYVSAADKQLRVEVRNGREV